MNRLREKIDSAILGFITGAALITTYFFNVLSIPPGIRVLSGGVAFVMGILTMIKVLRADN